MKLFVEGGGDAAELKTRCREGFTKFITKAGITKRPRVVACGGRGQAYRDFCRAVSQNESAMLLVDSEAAVAATDQQGDANQWQPWAHLANRFGDKWAKPPGTDDKDCHLMVQVMESWFIADRQTLKDYFKSEFKEGKLPAATNPLEEVSKTDVYDSLADATKNCKSTYHKGNHSFELLGKIDPAKVIAASPWAKRFIDCLKEKMAP